MTVEEAIKYFKNCNDRIISTAIDENAIDKNGRPRFLKETIDANNTAIRSLEAWEKVKKDIEISQESSFCTEDEKQGLDVAKIIINKHLKEVEK